MFDDMVEAYQLDITLEEMNLVKALIDGNKKRSTYVSFSPFSNLNGNGDDRLGETMPFLFEIVANQRNGLDVDKYVVSAVVLLYARVVTCDTIDSTTSCGIAMRWAIEATFLFRGECRSMGFPSDTILTPRVLPPFPDLSTLRASSMARYATISRTQTRSTNCFIPGFLSTNGFTITRPVRFHFP